MRFLSLRGRRRGLRSGFTMVDLLVVVLVVLFLLGFWLMTLPRRHGGSRKTQCSNQLKNVVLATHNFESVFSRLPGKNAATPGRFSIHTDLLPFIEQRAWYDRLNLAIGGPTLGLIAADATPLSQFSLTNNGEVTPGADPGAAAAFAIQSGATRAGSHRAAVATKIPAYNCPSDLGPASVVMAGNSYCPVVTAGGRMAGTNAPLEAIWVADNEGVSGSAIPNGVNPITQKRMNPTTIEGIADGSSNTIGLAERIKGVRGGGRKVPENTAWTGAESMGFAVEKGVIPDQAYTDDTAGDNRIAIGRCRQNMLAATNPITGPAGNDLSGVQWFQHTCAWLGCANTMAPPNSPVCLGAAGKDIAESGHAPPSSYHSGGANCGFMDGTVRFVNDAVDVRVFHALGTANGGERHELTP